MKNIMPKLQILLGLKNSCLQVNFDGLGIQIMENADNVELFQYRSSNIQLLFKMQNKQSQGQLKNLRQVDLRALEKPKTLIILHYKQRRISVPLFKEVFNLAELLYHHISTLEQNILSNDPNWEKKANQQIVCFQIKKQQPNDSDRLGDGDLRSDILLSLLRIEGEPTVEQLLLRVDVTRVYKFLEIQPYFRFFEKQPPIYRDSTRSPYFAFARLLSNTPNANVYLARRIADGYFFVIRVFATGSKVGVSQAHVIQHMALVDEQGSQGRCSLLVRSQQIAYIPHPQAESSEEEQDISTCRYVSLIHPYFVRGSLQDLLQEARFGRRRISDIDCLNYLKELMGGVHLLHEKYNLVHRALTPANIMIDQNGQLRLTTFAYCVPCYDNQGVFATYQPRSKYPKPGYALEDLAAEEGLELGECAAPELQRGDGYNYLVDFYSVGAIIKRLYQQSQALQRAPVSQNNQNLMMAMIKKLTSTDLNDRASIVQEILEDIQKEDLESDSQLPSTHSLTLQDIKVGRQLEMGGSKKFIQNEEMTNGIDHETVFNFFKKPLLSKTKSTLKRRKGSKQKISAKNSREKSEKCLSKASQSVNQTSQTKKRKLSGTKNRSFNVGKEDAQKRSSQNLSQKRMTGDSPIGRKTGKSKSQEKKKHEGPPIISKLFTNHEQDKRVPVMLPRSPKVGPSIPLRTKSPAMREHRKADY